MPYTGATLSRLNNFTKNWQTGRTVAADFLPNDLYQALKPNMQTEGFKGLYAEVLLKLTRSMNARPHMQITDIPVPGYPTYELAKIPLCRVINNIGATSEVLDRVTGGDASWGKIVADLIADGMKDFDWYLECAIAGNGTGFLARVVSATIDGTSVTVNCDNLYKDSGWDNVQMIRKGQKIEIYASNGTTQRSDGSSNIEWAVTNRTFGDRNNGDGSGITGSFVITADGTLQAAIADNDIVYIAGSHSGAIAESLSTPPVPMGLLGIVQGNGDNYAGAADVTTFQQHTRSDYPMLQGRVYQASDFASGGVDGAPADWDTRVISNIIDEVEGGDGAGEVSHLFCNSNLAMAIASQSRSSTNVSVVVSNTASATSQAAVGEQFATKFVTPKGKVIPIHVVRVIPNNCLYGLTIEDMRWHVFGTFDYLRLRGDIWGKSEGDRLVNYEAPYGGYAQLSAERCDNCLCIQDLLDNI